MSLIAQGQMPRGHIPSRTSAETTSHGKLPNDENLRILGLREKQCSNIQYRVMKAFRTNYTLILGIWTARMRRAILQGRNDSDLATLAKTLTHYGLQYLDVFCFSHIAAHEPLPDPLTFQAPAYGNFLRDFSLKLHTGEHAQLSSIKKHKVHEYAGKELQLSRKTFFRKVAFCAIFAMQHARDYDNALTIPSLCQLLHEMLSAARRIKSFKIQISNTIGSI